MDRWMEWSLPYPATDLSKVNCPYPKSMCHCGIRKNTLFYMTRDPVTLSMCPYVDRILMFYLSCPESSFSDHVLGKVFERGLIQGPVCNVSKRNTRVCDLLDRVVCVPYMYNSKNEFIFTFSWEPERPVFKDWSVFVNLKPFGALFIHQIFVKKSTMCQELF